MIHSWLEKTLKEIHDIENIEKLKSYSKKIVNINIFYKDTDIICNSKVLIKNFLCKALMKREMELTKLNKNPYSLNNMLSKHLYNGKILRSFNLDGFNLAIGSIPGVFFKKVENKRDAAHKIYELFADFSLRFNYEFNSEYDDSELKRKNKTIPQTKEFEQELSQIINQKVKLKYIGSGFNGNCFKLTICGKHFVYKCFFPYAKTSAHRYYSHGNYAEPQMGLFTRKNSRKNMFVKFFFGKIAHEYKMDSFFVSEYEEKNVDFKPKKQPHLLLDYVNISQTEMNKFDNTINGKIVDFGGVRIKIPEYEDKKVKTMVRVICKHISYSYNTDELSNSWFVKEKDFVSLKNYVEKHEFKTYLKALDVIKKYKKSFPTKLYKNLKRIKEVNIKNLTIKETFDIESLLNLRATKAISMAEYFDVKVKTHCTPIPEFNMKGNIILDLYNDLQCVCFYSEENIEHYRVEKFVDNDFLVLAEKKI